MAATVPSQRNRCPVFTWCAATGLRHRLHMSEAMSLTTAAGVLLRVSLAAEGERPPFVQLEVAFERGGPLMHVVELEAGEAVELAGLFTRAARATQVTGDDRR